MPELPRLKVRSLINGDKTEINDLEQVKAHFDAGADTVVIVEGRIMNSYDELTRMIGQGQFGGKDPLEVMLVPVIDGG